MSSTPTMRDPTIELSIWEGSKMAMALRAYRRDALHLLKRSKAAPPITW